MHINISLKLAVIALCQKWGHCIVNWLILCFAFGVIILFVRSWQKCVGASAKTERGLALNCSIVVRTETSTQTRQMQRLTLPQSWNDQDNRIIYRCAQGYNYRLFLHSQLICWFVSHLILLWKKCQKCMKMLIANYAPGVLKLVVLPDL